MTDQEKLEQLFGKDAVAGHVAFMKHCHYIKTRMPKHVTFDSVVQKIAENRSYTLVGGLIFVHESKLEALNEFLDKTKALQPTPAK